MAAFEQRTAQKPLTVCIQIESCSNFGDPVICKVTITTDDEKEQHLLRRETPLEGLRSDIFTVSKDGEEIPYDGIMVKRGPLSGEEYIPIKANSPLDTKVDLNEGYTFAAGVYTAQLNMNAIYVENVENPEDYSSQKIVSNIVTFKLKENEKSPKEIFSCKEESKIHKFYDGSRRIIPPKLIGNYPDEKQKSHTRDAYYRAYSMIERSIESTTRDPDLYRKWFGGDPDPEKKVKSNYEKMKEKMETTEVTLHGFANETENDTIGKTLGIVAAASRKTRTIYLCDSFFARKVVGKESKMGTIVHEMSHLGANTGDEKSDQDVTAYGEEKCLKLAENTPQKSRNNADNYQFFAEAQQDEAPSMWNSIWNSLWDSCNII